MENQHRDRRETVKILALIEDDLMPVGRGQIWRAGHQPWQQVVNQSTSLVRSQVNNQMWLQVWDQVRVEVLDQINGSL